MNQHACQATPVDSIKLGLLVAASALAALLSSGALAVPPNTCNGLAVNLAGATDGDDDLVGTAGDDVIHLGDGDDTFEDNLGGNDTVCGGDGDDDISGGDGNDTLLGEGGDDDLDGEAGDDTVDGGPNPSSSSFTERVRGGSGNDMVIGGEGNEILFGGSGMDTLDGGPGNDILNGGSDDDILMGGPGDDELIGEAGNNTLDGGPDTDLAMFVFGPVTASLATGMASHNGGDTDTMSMIENLEGTFTNDTLIGDASDNFLKGNGGDDILDGGAGNDELRGDDGNDAMIGGPGDDIFDGDVPGILCDLIIGNIDEVDFSGAAGPVVASTGTGTATGEGNDTLINILAIRGSAFDDALTAPRVNGGPGDDTLTGDEIDYSDSPAGVTVNLDTGTAADGHGGTDTILDGWNVRGSAFDDDLTGPGAGASFPPFNLFFGPLLTGGPGDDVLRRVFFGPLIMADYSGLVPACTLNSAGLSNSPYAFIIFAGPPTRPGDFVGAAGPVTVDLVAGTATGWGNDTLDGILGAIGSPLGDTLIGDDRPNTFYGMGGDDNITGGDGFDPEGMIDGIDFLVGGAGADVIAGGAGFDEIAGEDGNDDLSGGDGDDDINGGAGSNMIDGGAGEDEASYIGASSVTADLVAGTGIHLGVDTFTSIENLEGSNGSDTLRGDDGPNRIRGGSGSDDIEGRGDNDSLNGEGGNDTVDGGQGDDMVSGGFNDDVLIGGDGDDTLHGGGTNLIGFSTTQVGNDTASYASATGPITADLGAGAVTGEGTDTLIFVDNLIGSPSADTLTGDTYPNTLEGMGGDDFLDGMGGDDTMDGGANSDECVRDEPGDVLISCETETAGQASGTIVIVKDTVPNDFRDFEFNGSMGIGQFFVQEGNPATFANIAIGQYTITEVVLPDWPVSSIVCDDADSTGDVPSATATIELQASEIVTCTFTNALSDVIFRDGFE